VPLREVVVRSLEPHVAADDRERVIVEGPPVWLPPNTAATFHLAFHELATNAVRHGSLSVPQGHVEVSWTLERVTRHRPPMAAIVWSERRGPAVRPPGRHGFGLQLLKRGLAREFGAKVGFEFAPEGLECRIRWALATRPQPNPDSSDKGRPRAAGRAGTGASVCAPPGDADEAQPVPWRPVVRAGTE
jgi:two-component sensor histidine kinase